MEIVKNHSKPESLDLPSVIINQIKQYQTEGRTILVSDNFCSRGERCTLISLVIKIKVNTVYKFAKYI